MAEIWGAAIVAAGTIYASSQQKKAAGKAARAQQNAANAAIDQTEQNYQRTANNLTPYINAGNSAIGTIGALNNGNFASFHADPGYQFAFDQGLQGLDRSAAARGSLYSGGHSADVINYAQGMADQQYGNYYSRLMQTAGLGQNAASNLGSVGTGNAASIGGYLQNSANAQANGYINSANANSNMIGQLAGLAGSYFGNQSPTATSYNLGGNGAQPYQGYNNGSLSNGTFDFTRASGGIY